MSHQGSSEILRDLLEIARELVDGPPGDEGECWYCGGALEAVPGCPWHGEDVNCFGFMFDGDHDDDCMMVALRDTVTRYDTAEHELRE